MTLRDVVIVPYLLMLAVAWIYGFIGICVGSLMIDIILASVANFYPLVGPKSYF